MHAQQIGRPLPSRSPVTAHGNKQPRRCLTLTAAAARPGPLVGLQRLPDSQESTTVMERRAADVAVIGGGITAVLSAYTLARAGKKASWPQRHENFHHQNQHVRQGVSSVASIQVQQLHVPRQLMSHVIFVLCRCCNALSISQTSCMPTLRQHHITVYTYPLYPCRSFCCLTMA
jgi:hypothetical protein